MSLTDWKNLPNTSTPVNETNLNNINSDLVNVGTSIDSNYKANILHSDNLFTNSNLTNGYLNPDGTITTNPQFKVSDYININNIKSLTISGNSGGSERICFYNSSKTFISDVNTRTSTSMSFDVPNNAYYVRTTINVNNLSNYKLFVTPTINVNEEDIYKIEKGVNTNGSFIKYADGTLICLKQVTKTFTSVSQWGSLYDAVIGNDVCGDWAYPFVTTPRVMATPVTNSAFIESVKNYNNTSAGLVVVARANNISSSNPWSPVIDIVAIGNWK